MAETADGKQDTAQHQDREGPVRGQSGRSPAAEVGLLVLAIFFTLHVTRDLLLPVVLALLLSLLLSPLVRLLEGLRLPSAVAAGVVVLSLIAGIAGVATVLIEPAYSWLQKAPRILNELQIKLAPIQETVSQVSETAESVEKMAASEGEAPIEIQQDTLRDTLFSNFGLLFSGVVVGTFLLFFMLASKNLVMHKLVEAFSKEDDRDRVRAVVYNLEVEISRYLLTIGMVNIVLALVVAGALYLLGMPNPFLWGAMAGLLNFIPYIGPFIALVIISTAALLSFDTAGQALLVPLVFLVLTSLEGQLTTPLFLGRRMELNPLVVFFSIVFWGWLWGAVGALIAVPLTVSAKIVFDRTQRLALVGHFLGR